MTNDPYRHLLPHERTDDNLRAAIKVCRKYPDKGFLRRELPRLLAELNKRERRNHQ